MTTASEIVARVLERGDHASLDNFMEAIRNARTATEHASLINEMIRQADEKPPQGLSGITHADAVDMPTIEFDVRDDSLVTCKISGLQHEDRAVSIQWNGSVFTVKAQDSLGQMVSYIPSKPGGTALRIASGKLVNETAG